MKKTATLPDGGPEVQVDEDCLKPGRLWVHKSLGEGLFWVVTDPTTGSVVARFDRKADADKARKVLEKGPLTLEGVLTILGQSDEKRRPSGAVYPPLKP